MTAGLCPPGGTTRCGWTSGRGGQAGTGGVWSARVGYDAPAENDLVCGEYIIRFRFVEWWGGLTAPREDVVLAG